MKFILNILIILFITPTIAEDRKSVISSIDNDKIIISKQYFDKNVFLYCKVQEYIEFKDNVIVASYLRSQISNASAIDGKPAKKKKDKYNISVNFSPLR